MITINRQEINQESVRQTWIHGRRVALTFNHPDLEQARRQMLAGVDQIEEFQRGVDDVVARIGEENLL